MKKFIERFYVGLILLFLYAPILVLIVFSFNDSKSRTIWEGFTFRWYIELFQDDLVMSSLWTTISVALLAAIIATIVGTISAIGISNMSKLPRTAVLTVNNLPVMNPDIITGVSLMLLFVALNIELGFHTLLLAHITFNIPYVILSVMPKIRQLDKHVYEAAIDLGAAPFKAFMKVVLPDIVPGVITGFIIALTLSIDDFVISYFTSGSGAQTLATTIYSMTKKRVSPEINALSTIMFVTVLILLIVVNLRQKRDDEKLKMQTKNLKREGELLS